MKVNELIKFLNEIPEEKKEYSVNCCQDISGTRTTSRATALSLDDEYKMMIVGYKIFWGTKK